MSKTRYTHNKAAAVSFKNGTPKRTKWGGGNPRRTEIDPSFRGGLRTRKRIGTYHIDRFHKQNSGTEAQTAGIALSATAVTIVAEADTSLVIEEGQVITATGATEALEAGNSYTGVSGTANASGTGATFDIEFAAVGGAATVTVAEPGKGYIATEVVTIAQADLGGVADVDITIFNIRGLTHDNAGSGGKFKVDFAATTGVATVEVLEGGAGLAVNDTVTVDTADMPATASDLVITIDNVSEGEDAAFSTHPVANVSATLAVKPGGGTADDTTTISKTSKVAGGK